MPERCDAYAMHESSLIDVPLDELSRAQLRVAEEFRATPGMRPANDEEGRVYLYRHDPVATERWLVDRKGRILEVTRFRNSVTSVRRLHLVSPTPGR